MAPEFEHHQQITSPERVKPKKEEEFRQEIVDFVKSAKTEDDHLLDVIQDYSNLETYTSVSPDVFAPNEHHGVDLGLGRDFQRTTRRVIQRLLADDDYREAFKRMSNLGADYRKAIRARYQAEAKEGKHNDGRMNARVTFEFTHNLEGIRHEKVMELRRLAKKQPPTPLQE